MAVWQKRVKLYRAGFVAIILGSVVFALAFCTPAWVLYSNRQHLNHMGLWQTCVEDLSLCTSSMGSDNPGWLKAVRALECIAMFFAVAGCMIGVYSNCFSKANNSPELFNKNMETSSIVSVIFGTFSLVIFATQARGYHSDMEGRVSWSFVLACVADGLIGLGAFTMLVSRRLQIIALQNYFEHRQFQDSFHTEIQFPNYAVGPCADGEGAAGRRLNGGHPNPDMVVAPPAYETVVNCSSQQDSALPPTYSEAVSENNGAVNAVPLQGGQST